MRKELEELTQELKIQDNVQFLGFVKHKMVPIFIGASDIAIAPFDKTVTGKRGLSPLKLYNYLACARPVVISDIWLEIEPEHKQKILYLVEPENPEELARAVVYLLRHPERAKVMGDRGYELVKKYYNWEHSAKKIMGIFRGPNKRN